jgi:rRNA maturation protein Nop10
VRRRSLAAPATISLALLAAFCVAVPTAVAAGDGPYDFPNSAIADRAEQYANGAYAGQCLVFASEMIRAAGGALFSFGYNTGSYQAQWAQRATAVGSPEEAERGDVVQWGGGAGGTLDPHTAIVTQPGPDPVVIDSNWAGTERVGRGSFSSRNRAGAVYRIWRVGSGGDSDLSFVKTRDTGSGAIEAHTATRASGYESGVSSPTRFSPGDAGTGWFAMLPSTDVAFVKIVRTGSGRVEMHTATRASGYQTGVSAPTRFSSGDALNGWFGVLPDGDVYFVKTRNTGSGQVEVHTATRASGYQAGVSSPTRFSPGDALNGRFGVLPDGDVYFVKTRNAASGTIEAFTATRASGYQTGISSPTRFSAGDAGNGWFKMLADADVTFVKTRNTGSGRVEVHTATRASGYQTGISTVTRFSPLDADHGWFSLVG